MIIGRIGDENEESGLAGAIAQVLDEVGPFESTTVGAATVYENVGRFAELVELRKWADLSFVVGAPVDHQRVRSLMLTVPGGWSHTVRLYALEDVDQELAEWLRTAYEHGTEGQLVEEISPLTSTQLARFSAVFGSEVVRVDREFAILVPGVLRLAMGDNTSVVVSVSGIEYDTEVFIVDDEAYIPVDDVTGLGEGRTTEVTLRARL